MVLLDEVVLVVGVLLLSVQGTKIEVSGLPFEGVKVPISLG